MIDRTKISVIVPVYKVEPYIRRCLDSIIGQTYQNLEILVVDDGSPDQCGAICDEYSRKDSRIRVIHQKNGGLASARNTGLREATGYYIGWVDSDDWIEKDMFEILVRRAEQYSADIVVCGYWEQYSKKKIKKGSDSLLLLNKEIAMELLLQNEQIKYHVWDKLWRKELFIDIYFPEGHNFEDAAVTYKLFEKAERIVCIPDIEYNYLQREDSIMRDPSLINRLDNYLAAKSRYNGLIKHWPQFGELLKSQILLASISVWCCYLANPLQIRREYKDQVFRISSYSKKDYKNILESIDLGIAGRIVALLLPYPTWWSFAIARLIGGLYCLKNGRYL